MARSSRIAKTKEGGRNARPLGAIARTLLCACVAAVILCALMESGAPELVASLQGDDVDRAQDVAEGDIREIDWKSLPDSVVAWVEVPGTNVDGPVAQGTADRPDYFLYNDALGQGAFGTPYIDWECAPDSDYIAVYGHHMNDGSQFADFAKFIDRGYAEEHRIVYWYGREDGGRIELEVVAADVVNAAFETQRTGFADDNDRIEYLAGKLADSDLVIGECDPGLERVFSFATCSYQTSNSRTVVYATALNE